MCGGGVSVVMWMCVVLLSEALDATILLHGIIHFWHQSNDDTDESDDDVSEVRHLLLNT